MKNLITKIMIALTAVAMLIGMSSCYTERTAQKQVDKAHHRFPQVPAKLCAERYAPTDSVSIVTEYINGGDIISTDTVIEIQVFTDTVILTKYITRTVQSTDTIRDTKYVQLENKAAVVLKEAEINKLGDRVIGLTDSRNDWRRYALILSGLLCVYVLYRVAGIYLKKN